MKNIRLYIGGQRADLDSAITMPFNYQTTDSENPTAVKNSFSKTITLQGTDRNRRLFGGIWKLDSLVSDMPQPYTVGVFNDDFNDDFQQEITIYPNTDGVYFNPMKRVPFLLYVDEMVVERGYCQLVAINRKGRDYTFSVSLYGGLGEFFYNLQTSEDGEPKRLADLDWGADLGFTINKTFVQQNWDDLLGGTLPTIAFVPMHNGTPETIDAKKALIYGGGIPASITDGGTTYTRKSGYLLASLERKYTEWEMGDLRSYLQRPALRLKDFITAVCDPNNNGGWAVERRCVQG